MGKNPREYWYVHGQAYDLRSYAKFHPGGESQLMALQGRDITEMVYSMHALVSVDNVKKILEKFKVENVKDDAPDTFSWKEDGLYSVLKRRVNEYFKKNNENPKSDNKFWFFILLEAFLQVILLYWWIFGRTYWIPTISGLVTTSLAFMIFHTAGHNGISKNPKVNNFWYKIYADFIIGFVASVWNIHHNYAHHAYTNIHRKDPDVSNAAALIRKSPHQTPKPQHKAQWFTAYILLVFLPNQWIGQVIQYFMSTLRGKIFGVPLLHKREKSLRPFFCFGMTNVIVGTLIFINQGLSFTALSMYLYSLGAGFGYWACVFPNHDTDLSEQSCIAEVVEKDSDWGEHQIKHSSNFWIPDFVSYLIGGMNYQIEHHLFPTVHPRHYPAVAKIVKEECAKRNIPYHRHSSWFDALRGNFKHLRVMSKGKQA